MKIVVFGLTISSSWGNGHATLWRGLCRALARRRHRVVFYEHDVSYYAQNRDLAEVPGGELVLYDDWSGVRRRAEGDLADADVAMVTSYCPHGIEATALTAAASRPVRVFYDLDTPVTLSRLTRGETVPYIGPRGLADFDLVLSYTGGRALDELRARLGARRVAPLYGHVDPEVHRPVPRVERFACDLSYLGTYAADRQAALEALFVEPARQRPDQRFLIGGAQYPADFPWTKNIYFVRHLPPPDHPAFFSSSRLTLNVTREAMAAMGWCPSGRLFEAAACGVPIVTDAWEGLDAFFSPGRDILVARDTADSVAALDLSDLELDRIRTAARERTLAEHTSGRRAEDLLAALDEARRPDRSQGSDGSLSRDRDEAASPASQERTEVRHGASAPSWSRPDGSVPIGTARALRKRLTPQEAKLWLRLRALRPQGLHFRRQIPIGGFVVDFVCLKRRVVVEVDGGQHAGALHGRRDRARDAGLADLGFQVLRFWNADVDADPDAVAQTVFARLSDTPEAASRLTPPQPSPEGREVAPSSREGDVPGVRRRASLPSGEGRVGSRAEGASLTAMGRHERAASRPTQPCLVPSGLGPMLAQDTEEA